MPLPPSICLPFLHHQHLDLTKEMIPAYKMNRLSFPLFRGTFFGEEIRIPVVSISLLSLPSNPSPFVKAAHLSPLTFDLSSIHPLTQSAFHPSPSLSTISPSHLISSTSTHYLFRTPTFAIANSPLVISTTSFCCSTESILD